jgi:hypothetical protein
MQIYWSTLTLFNQAPQNVETKIEFPQSEFHRQMANKKKRKVFLKHYLFHYWMM